MRGIRIGLGVVVVSLALASCDSPAAPDAGGQTDGSVDAAAICAGGAADGTACGASRICIEGACVPNECGDGFVDPEFEQCDDGNETAFDGCEPDTCEFTCMDDDACDDDNACTGAESCNPDTHVCVDAPDAADGSDCNRFDPPGAPGVCRAGTCAPPGCGNGAPEEGEDCDDGNTSQGDGCENDCTFTCANDAACSDGDTCNGPETCDLTTHVCSPSTGPATDGTACTSPTLPSGICLGGGCMVAGCANGFVEPSEDCDDGNAMDGDGCDNDCTFSCTADPDCADTDPCDGPETCDVSTHTCQPPTTTGADGTACTRGDGSAGICLSALCAMAGCGNGFVEPDEDCEDGNATNGDGCDSCQYSCEADEDCVDTDICDGAETCDTTTHICQPPAASAEDGHDCSTDTTPRICVGAVCVLGGCGNSYLESGEDCDDGNTNQTDGCKNDCTFTCIADVDCSDGNDCDGAETCDLTAHTCGEGTPLGNGASCTTLTIPTGVCVSNTCIMAGCGNGFVEPGEECDDDNSTEGDGCDTDCTFSCTTAADCDDGNVCTGAETCNTTTHTCVNPPDLSCTPSDACHTASCDPSAGCQDTLIDADGDGHAPGAFTCSSDCNDGNAAIYFGAEELCDLLDNNCNGATDEISPTWYIDCDRDGYAADTTGAITTCTLPAGAPSGCPGGTWTSLRPSGASTIDCDDGNAARDPGNIEIVGNEVDNDCNNTEICYRDGDNDGARLTTTVASADVDCDDSGEEVSSAPIDCNDGTSAVRPGIAEVPGNGVDNDCNGQEICYRNTDGDGYRTGSTFTSADADCSDPGEALSSRADGDCNDSSATVYPGALERCDAIDQNCSGGTQEGCPSSTETYGTILSSPTFGSTAGLAGESACPAGTVMVGINAYHGSDVVIGYAAVCRQVSIVASAGSPDYVYELRTSGSDLVQPAHGLAAGTLTQMRCGTNSFVRGIHPHANASQLRYLQMYCGAYRWTRVGTTTTWTGGWVTTTTPSGVGSAIDTHYEHVCGSNYLARRLFGDEQSGSISFAMSIGVSCHRIEDDPQ